MQDVRLGQMNGQNVRLCRLLQIAGAGQPRATGQLLPEVPCLPSFRIDDI